VSDHPGPENGPSIAADPELTSDEIPTSGLYPTETRTPHEIAMDLKEAKTRDILAYGIVGVLALYNLLLIGGLFAGFISVDDLVRTVGAMSGISTLGAAVAGFYFARGKGRS
jgi:hypothetical protein